MIAFLLAVQAAVSPDISLHASIEAGSVKVEKRGEATARAWAEPDGGSETWSAGSGQSGRFELKLDARIAPLVAHSLKATDPEQPR